MNEATEKKESDTLMSELDMPQWSVVSFDACEASDLTYRQAVELLSQKESDGVYGLCIVTNEAAERIRSGI
jgi:hypothetical protein